MRKTVLKILLLIGLGGGVVFLWETFPLISGYGAKVMCSAVFVAGRDPGVVSREDLGRFPFNLGRYVVSWKDSSITASVWGLAKTRAIYRKGLGATLVNGVDERYLRRQVSDSVLAVAPRVNTDTIDWPWGFVDASLC